MLIVKFRGLIDKIIQVLSTIIMGVMVIAVCWQVITRFLLNNPSKYTEEFLRYALIWMTMLGVPYAYGQERHISINIITKTFSLKGSLFTKMVIEIIVMILCVTVFIAGGIMVTMNSAGQISPALQLPMPLYYVGLPICGVLTLIYSADRLIRFARQLKEAA